jgi:diguanylate cyclase
MADSGYPAIVLDRLAKQAVQLLGVERSYILVHNEHDPTTAIIAAAHGAEKGLIGEQVAIGAADSSARGVAVQLRWAGDVQGSLVLSGRCAPDALSATEMSVLGALAAVVSGAVFHAQTRAGGGAAARAELARFCGTLDRGDRCTSRHSHDVVRTASLIGSALGLDCVALAELEVAALLHDIGKARVPESILSKPGPLTSEEHALMARHPEWGAEMLARVPGLEAVAMIVRFHHERWDGGGYPTGLSGPRIPLASRIIAVCDSHNAMTADRPYRLAMGEARAIQELRAGAGSQFDPGAVAQLEAVLSRQAAA